MQAPYGSIMVHPINSISEMNLVSVGVTLQATVGQIQFLGTTSFLKLDATATANLLTVASPTSTTASTIILAGSGIRVEASATITAATSVTLDYSPNTLILNQNADITAQAGDVNLDVASPCGNIYAETPMALTATNDINIDCPVIGNGTGTVPEYRFFILKKTKTTKNEQTKKIFLNTTSLFVRVLCVLSTNYSYSSPQSFTG